MVAILWSMADWRPVTLSTNSLLSFFSDDTGGGGGGGGGGQGARYLGYLGPRGNGKKPMGNEAQHFPPGGDPK